LERGAAASEALSGPVEEPASLNRLIQPCRFIVVDLPSTMGRPQRARHLIERSTLRPADCLGQLLDNHRSQPCSGRIGQSDLVRTIGVVRLTPIQRHESLRIVWCRKHSSISEALPVGAVGASLVLVLAAFRVSDLRAQVRRIGERGGQE
jgi:hypothetical protein